MQIKQREQVTWIKYALCLKKRRQTVKPKHLSDTNKSGFGFKFHNKACLSAWTTSSLPTKYYLLSLTDGPDSSHFPPLMTIQWLCFFLTLSQSAFIKTTEPKPCCFLPMRGKLNSPVLRVISPFTEWKTDTINACTCITSVVFQLNSVHPSNTLTLLNRTLKQKTVQIKV